MNSTKLNILAALLFLSISVHGQCYLRELPTDEATDLVNGNEERSSGNIQIDQWIQFELNPILQIFNLNSKFFFYDDGDNPNALATCDCNSSGSCDGIVKFGKNLLYQETYSYNGGRDAVIGVLAHEFAHILQCKRQWFDRDKKKELHADFMAGYILGQKANFQFTNIASFANTLFQLGSDSFSDEASHGNPEERVRYMTLGSYYRSLNANDAYDVGKRWLEGTIGNYNIYGDWQSTSGNKFRVFNQSGNTYYQSLITGITTSAAQIEQNVFRALFYQMNQFGQPARDMYGNLIIIDQIDLVVVDSRKIIASSRQGTSVWTRL
ncbi:MAG: hypothetical protein HWE39_24210 [Oceanospirillaceae bacterium]|nr:hypothetical protein [Oceanospirillaceae bacterium]